MEELMQATQTASYFLWEYTRYDNALELWYCVEDIAFYIERRNILTTEDMRELVNREKSDYGYVELVRNLSYRLYLFTGNSSSKFNWFTVESLINNAEWCRAMVTMANIYRRVYQKELNADIIRSAKIRRYYNE